MQCSAVQYYLSGAEVEALAGVGSSDECRVETHGHVRPPHGDALVAGVSGVKSGRSLIIRVDGNIGMVRGFMTVTSVRVY